MMNHGQTRQELKKEKNKVTEEIKATKSTLSATQSKRKVTAAEVFALQDQINARQANIKTIFEELELTEMSIENSEAVITSLTSDLTRLKEGYAKMLRHAYRNKNSDRRLLFLLSSENFNKAIQRWQYLKRYDEQRKRQGILIREMQASLNRKVNQLKIRKADKESMVKTLEAEQALVAKELEKKDKILKALAGKERKLLATLDGKKALRGQLTNAIDQAIRADRRTTKAAAFSNPNAVTTPTKLSKQEKAISSEFIKEKGKLPFPTKGNIVSRFGRQPHPKLKNVTIKNNGIDIRTAPKAKAKVVFDGIVMNVFFVPGFQNGVMVRHGDYYTVYSNLESITVSKGTRVKAGQIIGVIGENKDSGKPELHFELWKSNNRLNPEYWVKK